MKQLFQRDGYLNPVLLQATGMLLLLGFAVLWVLTGKESALLIGAALTLIGIGSAGGALVTVRQENVVKAEELKQAIETERRETGG